MAEGKSTPASGSNAAGAGTTSTSTSNDQPGRPYYENLRSTLRQSIRRKEIIDAELAALEDKIYRDESTYLEETSGAGNIVRGFDNWVKGVVVGGGRADDRRGGRNMANRIREEDRIFSRSSMTWLKSQEAPTEPPSVATSSPGTGTQTPVTANPKSNPKNRKKSLAALENEEEDAKPSKRTKISYAAA